MNRIALIFLFSLILLCGSATADVPGLGFEDDLAAFNTEVEALRDKQDFSGLEKLRIKFVQGKPRFRNSDLKLPRLYSLLLQCPQTGRDCGDFRDAWRKAGGGSPIPFVLTAKVALQKAWRIRGADVAPDKTSETGKQLDQSLKDAIAALDAAKKLEPLDPEYYTALLEARSLREDKEESRKQAFDLGVALDPAYDPLYFARAIYLLPRWGGAKGDSERLADEAVEKSRFLLGSGMYAKITHRLEPYFRRDFYSQTSFSWDKVKKGYEDLMLRFPKSYPLYADYLRAAFRAEDRAAMRTFIAQIGDTYDPRMDGVSAKAFSELVQWSRQPVKEAQAAQ